MQRQLLHACFITQNGALRALATGVDGKHGELATLLFQHVHAKLIDAGRFTGTRHTADANAHGVAAIGKTLFNDLLCTLLVVGIHALHQCDSLTQHRHVTLADAFHDFCHRQFTTPPAFQVGIDD